MSVRLVVLLLAAVCGAGGQELSGCWAGQACGGAAVDLTNHTWAECCSGREGERSFTNTNGRCYDCNELVVELSGGGVAVGEGEGAVGLLVVRWGVAGEAIDLQMVLRDDDPVMPSSAEGGRDYGPFPAAVVMLRITLYPGETELLFAVPLLDDGIVEYPEGFSAELSLDESSSRNPSGVRVGDNETRVTIIDNDFVNISIVAPNNETVLVSYSEDEAFVEVSVQLVRRGSAVRDVAFRVFTLSNSAQGGRDFATIDRIITLSPSDENITVTVTISDDGDVEKDIETFQLHFEPATNETGIRFAQDNINFTIFDNDVADIGFTADVFEALELTGVAMVTVELNGTTDRPVVVVLSTAAVVAGGASGIGATEGVDYDPTTKTLTFDSAMRRVTVAINISRDGIVEAREEFLVRLSVPLSERGVRLTRTEARVVIEDRDLVTFGFTERNMSVSESGSNVTVGVALLEGMIERNVTVVAMTIIGGMAVASRDFMALQPLMLTFDPAMATLSFDVTITILDDLLFEGPEEFTIQLSSSDGSVLLRPNQVVVTITDDEPLLVEFLQPSYAANETASSVSVSLALRSNAERTVALSLSTMDGSAKAGLDYIAVVVPFTVSNVGPQFSASIQLRDDIANEGVETFIVRVIAEATGEEIANVTVSILDNEFIEVSLAATSFMVAEGDDYVSLLVNKTGVTATEVDIELVITDGTAEGGRDYGLFPSDSIVLPLGILPEETLFSLALPIIDDGAVESTETFHIQLRLPVGTGAAAGAIRLGSIVNATVSIEDNDVVEVFLDPGNYTLEEELMILPFNVTRNTSVLLNRPVQVQFRTQNGLAVAPLDYKETVQLIEFDATVSFVVVGVEVQEDELVDEGQESFFVTLEVPPGERGVRLTRSNSTVTIFDDDVLVVQTAAAVVTGREGSSVTLAVEITAGVAERTVEVLVTVLNGSGSATADEDFVVTADRVSFPPKTNLSSVTILLLDDSSVEDREEFVVVLSAPVGESGVTFGLMRSTRVLIEDVSSVNISLNFATIEVNEASSFVSLSMIKQGANERSVSVQLFTESGTANGIEDYTPLNQTVVFQPSGLSDRFPFTISLVNDDVFEEDEQFIVRLSMSESERGVLLGAIDRTVVTVINDDIISLGFEEGNYMVLESVGFVEVCLVKNGNHANVLDTAVITREVASPIRAISNVDYVQVLTTVSLEPADSRACLNISIIRDSDVEGIEQFEVIIFRPPDRVNVSRRMASVTIRDTAVLTVGFDRALVVVNESSGAAVLSVVLSAPAASAVVVTASAVSVTATAGEDFVDFVEDVTFQPGELRQMVSIGVIDDSAIELTETFSVVLSLPPNAVAILGPQPQIEVIILDNDVVPTEPPVGPVVIEFLQAAYTVLESAGVASLGVMVTTGTVSRDISVLFSTADGTAEAPSDYIAQVNTVVTFEPGQSLRSVITVTVNPDAVREGRESFAVRLSLPPGSAAGVELGARSQARVVIRDDGRLVNDSIVGDPLFTVPMLVNSSSQFPRQLGQPHLCYEIHGEAGSTFNLVSDRCTSVNAHYTSVAEGINVIDEIGIRAVDLNGRCILIKVNTSDNCMPRITDGNGAEVLLNGSYFSAGLSVAKYGSYVGVHVPNCENTELIMWLKCIGDGGDGMIRFVVTRGLNLNPTSHGLVGQFWNIPFLIEPFQYTGPPNSYFEEEQLYSVSVSPIDSLPRTFVAEYYEQTWELLRGTCFYAGSSQGGVLQEVDEPNDSVIEGRFRDYRTQGIYHTDFEFTRFDRSRCN